MKKSLIWPLMAILLSACSENKTPATYSVVPLPQEISLSSEMPFRLDSRTIITYTAGNELLQRDAEFLADYIYESTGKRLNVKEASELPTKGTITLAIDPSIENPEGYHLTTTSESVRLAGATAQGVFYGVQTLRKAIPATVDGTVILPAGEVKDAPRFPYRGMHLDVCRHFMPIEFVKKYIDLIALHNMNTFHWHLTEDQGWRIEIKKYPRLTEVGSVRQSTVVGRIGSGQFDGTPHGGFYTQEEAKEIVAYAQERFITVLPEIDLPGHMLAALAAYPSLGCTGGPYEVAQDWGVFDDVLCMGNDSVITFLQDVLSEIMEIFPSKYIHIGGDEAPRTRWKSCPKCQARIRKEGLKTDKEHTAEDRLQSYCMTRIERFLNEHGRQIIGWDEILDGDVAPNATVMSWRGSAGGIKAAQMGHDVVMTPNSHFYFDFYQSDDIKNEPLAIGGYLPLERVYSYNPTDGLTPEQASFIKGAQANVWTEYIPTTQQVEYMILPRMAALAEVQWTAVEKKNYEEFVQRLLPLIKIYQRDGLNYAKHLFNIKAEFNADPEKRAVMATLSTIDNAPIYYTHDGSEPTAQSTRYEGPVSLTSSTQFMAVAIRPEGTTPAVKKEVYFSRSTFCPIRLTGAQPTAEFSFGGAPTLVDGLQGNESYTTGAWLGFLGDITAIIDMGEPTSFSKVTTSTCTDLPSWVMGCYGLEVATSDDDKNYTVVATKAFPADTDITKKQVDHYEITFEPQTARYVRVLIKRCPALPKGHSGEGKEAFIFIDEIGIE